MAEKSLEPRRPRGRIPKPDREDGRVQHLAYLPPDIIQDIKRVSAEIGDHNYIVVEAALRWTLPKMLVKARKEGRDWNLRADEFGPEE